MTRLEPTYYDWEAIARFRGDRSAGVPPGLGGLWVCGHLEGLGRPCVAIVGTRAASSAGKSLARTTARELATAGLCIISGLALGIDGAAHEGALEAAAPTIGILGGGHQRFFPMRNRELALRMLTAGGAVCSPFPPEQPAQPYQFLQRNAIVAALADAVVVVEAPSRSGALNTAGWAAGRIPVLAFPGDVDRKNVAGCLALIRDGATLVRSAADIFEQLGLTPPQGADGLSLPDDPLERTLLHRLRGGPASVDELIASCASQPGNVLAAITALEQREYIQRREGSIIALATPINGW